MFPAARPIAIFLGVALLGALERYGLSDPSMHEENYKIVVEIMTWVITGIVAVAAIWFERHKKHTPPDGTVTVTTETTTTKYRMQPILDFIKGLKTKFVETPQR